MHYPTTTTTYTMLNSRKCILIELHSYQIHFVKILEDNTIYYYINVSQTTHY
jgi:hypothetical protein